MAVTTALTKIVCNMMLANGTTASGTTKTIPMSIGKIDKDNWDAAKAWALTGLIARVLDKDTGHVEIVQTSVLDEE